MKTLKNLAYSKDANIADWPLGNILNETENQEGTPVTRELYGEILVNLYKILLLTGTSPNNNEDSETNGYQLVDAIKLLPNALNDVEQVLSLSGTVWSSNIKISHLPDKYVFIAQASEDYDSSQAYTFKGNEIAPVYNFSAITSFSAGDKLLIIINQGGVQAVNLSVSQSQSQINTSFGTPLPLNSGAKMYFFNNGNLYSNDPMTVDLQDQVRIDSGDALAEIFDTFILNGHVLCFCFFPGTVTYAFYQWDLLDLNTIQSVSVNSISIPVGVNRQPYCYSDGQYVYLTNRAGNLDDDFEISKLLYDSNAQTLTLSSNFAVNAAFEKTTNAVIIDGNSFYSFVNSVLTEIDLGTGAIVSQTEYKSNNGYLFSFNGNSYFTNGETAVLWSLT